MNILHRQIQMDQLAVEDGDRSIRVYTHGQHIVLHVWNGEDGDAHKFTFNQLFEMISKLREEK